MPATVIPRRPTSSQTPPVVDSENAARRTPAPGAIAADARTNVIPDRWPDDRLAPGALGIPLSRKQQRRDVKKIVSRLEKLQREGRHSNPTHAGQGEGPDERFIAELSEGHARLRQYLEVGLSSRPPDFSLARSAKNGAALTAGAASVAVGLGTRATATVASTAVAAACAVPISAVSIVAGGMLGAIVYGVEWWSDDIWRGSESLFSDIVDGMTVGMKVGLVPLALVHAVHVPELDNIWIDHQAAQRWHDRTIGSLKRIACFEKARAYATRPRLPTARIASRCEARIAAELQRHHAAGSSAHGAPPVFSATGAPVRRDTSGSWRFPETEPDAAAFNRFQERVLKTQEYANQCARPALVERIDDLVAAMDASPPLRALCFTIAANALDSCGDRIALALNDMQLALVDEKARTGQLSDNALFSAGLEHFKLQILDQIALAKIASLHSRNASCDEIEVRLVYPTELAGRLGLSGVVRSMLHRNLAPVSRRELDAAGDTVRDCFVRGEQIAFLARWEPWRNSLERAHPTEFSPLRAEIAAQRDALSVTPEGMSDQQWISALDQQARHEETQLFELANELTEVFVVCAGPVAARAMRIS